MEPRLLRRGNSLALGKVQFCKSFNGATPSQTWKRVEPIRASGVGAASMEPRLLRRGNITWEILPLDDDGLQWSHAFSDVETIYPVADDWQPQELQWSHAFSDVETRFVEPPDCSG